MRATLHDAEWKPVVMVDVPRSSVIVAGRRWPACALICPDYEGDELGDWHHLLGGPFSHCEGKQFEIYVPLENGVLAEIIVMPTEPRYDLSLHIATTTAMHFATDGSWLPTSLSLTSTGDLVVNHRATPFHHCDPEWINETLDRASRKGVVGSGDGPACRLISLGEAEGIYRTHDAEAAA